MERQLKSIVFACKNGEFDNISPLNSDYKINETRIFVLTRILLLLNFLIMEIPNYDIMDYQLRRKYVTRTSLYAESPKKLSW